MTRALRVEYDGAVYHVMARGVGRIRTFSDDEDRLQFLERVGEVVATGDLVVHAYCLMPNHYHLLCETPKAGLSSCMHRINGTYSRIFNRRHRRPGHLWQGRYRGILVEDGRYFLECGRYIHLNPNRSKITRPAERYAWSSYRNYVGRGVVRTSWVSTSRTLKHFDGSPQRYRAFVESGRGEKPVSPFERAVAGLVLGSQKYVRQIREMVRGMNEEPELPTLGALRRQARASAEEVERILTPLVHAQPPRRQRRLLLYALRKYSTLRPAEIARRQSRSPAAVTLAARDLDQKAQTDPSLAQLLETLDAAFKGTKNCAETDGTSLLKTKN